MVEQLALDEDVQTILTTTKAGQKMTENEVYPAVLKKLVAVAGLDTENIQGVFTADMDSNARSEERRVGKECRSRWSPYH